MAAPEPLARGRARMSAGPAVGPHRLPFAKLHGLGNDFVIVEDFEVRWEPAPEEVARICDRHFGVGADGLILARPSERPDCAAYMHFFNADGSLAQMCGNGIRCFAKFLVDRGLAMPVDGRLTLDTPAGPRALAVELNAAGRLVRATVEMGAPQLELERVPVDAARARRVSPVGGDAPGAARGSTVELDSPWGAFEFICVSMGNPHAVCLIEDWAVMPVTLFAQGAERGLAGFDLARVGAFFEGHPAFPERVNVEFVDVATVPAALSMRVYERGVGETLACGTGACAVAVAGALTGRSGERVAVRLPGGELQVAWAGGAEPVYMTGPAEESFSGELVLP